MIGTKGRDHKHKATTRLIRGVTESVWWSPLSDEVLKVNVHARVIIGVELCWTGCLRNGTVVHGDATTR